MSRIQSLLGPAMFGGPPSPQLPKPYDYDQGGATYKAPLARSYQPPWLNKSIEEGISPLDAAASMYYAARKELWPVGEGLSSAEQMLNDLIPDMTPPRRDPQVQRDTIQRMQKDWDAAGRGLNAIGEGINSAEKMVNDFIPDIRIPKTPMERQADEIRAMARQATPQYRGGSGAMGTTPSAPAADPLIDQLLGQRSASAPSMPPSIPMTGAVQRGGGPALNPMNPMAATLTPQPPAPQSSGRPDWGPIMQDFFGGPAPGASAYGEQLRTPEQVNARVAEIERQAQSEYDAANPGRRQYNAARQANPGGRPFTNEELGQLPYNQAQHANVTLGGNWGNLFGDIDAERGLPGADPNSINAVPLRDLIDGTPRAQPVTVMDSRPDAGGGTRNIYPGAPREAKFGGDTVVRKVGNRYMFVDANQPQAEGGAGPTFEKMGRYIPPDPSTLGSQQPGYKAYQERVAADRQNRRALPAYQNAEAKGMMRNGMVPLPAGQDPFLTMALMNNPDLAVELVKTRQQSDLANRSLGLRAQELGMNTNLSREQMLQNWLLTSQQNERLGRVGDAQARLFDAQAANAGNRDNPFDQVMAAIIMNDPNIPTEQKARALEAMRNRGAGAGASAGGGPSVSDAIKPNIDPSVQADIFEPGDARVLEGLKGYSQRIIKYGKAKGWSDIKIDQAVRQYGGSNDRDWGGYWYDWLPFGGGSGTTQYIGSSPEQ